jgi:hypothetical protein
VTLMGKIIHLDYDNITLIFTKTFNLHGDVPLFQFRDDYSAKE